MRHVCPAVSLGGCPQHRRPPPARPRRRPPPPRPRPTPPRRPAPPPSDPAAPPDADLDLRLVRYFTVVAEHRHFGRAAAELLVAQPSLSRQVRRLERQLGARLLGRTPQGTQL